MIDMILFFGCVVVLVLWGIFTTFLILINFIADEGVDGNDK